jgi:hypothetical protein
MGRGLLRALSWRFPGSMRQGVQTVSGGPKVPCGDPAPTSLRHHYTAYRAFVRAKVTFPTARARHFLSPPLRQEGRAGEVANAPSAEAEVLHPHGPVFAASSHGDYENEGQSKDWLG